MGEKEKSEDLSHLQKASKNAQIGLFGLILGISHYILGFSEWTKNRHIVIQAGITTGISFGLVYIIDMAGELFFATFWEQAIYASGLRLRLLPIPISLVIYGLILSLVLLGLSLDSSIRSLESEINEIKEEMDISDDSQGSED